MTPESILRERRALSLVCWHPGCAAETSIDVRFFAARHGLQMTLNDLRTHLVCTGCGSRAFSLLTTSSRERGSCR